MRKFLLILLTCIVSTPQLFAIPAYPYPIKYKQPDGTEITIQLKGDERVHWAETGDGFTLLSNGKNGWEYAFTDSKGNLKKSGVIAHETNKRTNKETVFLRSVSKNLRFSKNQISILKSAWEARTGEENLIGTGSFYKGMVPNTPSNTKGVNRVFTPRGTKKLLLILIQFPDLHFTFTKKDFDDLMNTQNYNLNGASGSVRDYFLEQSYNQFDVQTYVAGIYTAQNNMAYYGTDAEDGSHDPNSHYLMEEAVNDADADVDFSQYDNDGDGSVDGVYIIYAGKGQASSGIANTIWPHAGGISGQTFDGKTVSKYSCSNELNSDGSLTGIGVICHEFGHVCGAPDYYDTDYSTGGQFPGTGNWDVMCGGCYNGTTANKGNVPSHFNPFEKIRAGWIAPITLSGSTSLSIPDYTNNPSVYIINTTTPNEYYLLENRQKTGFNRYVNGHGLLIYKYSKTYWDSHANKTYPEGFYLVNANISTNPTSTSSDPAVYGNVNSGYCPFPGTGNKFSFTDATIPSMQSWAGDNTGYPLTNITENSGTITLYVNGCPAVNSIQNFKAMGASSTQINLSWLNSSNVIIARNTTNTFGNPTSGTSYSSGNTLTGGGTIIYTGTASSFSDNSGLSASTTYYYQIWATDGSANYSLASAANGSTTCSSISQPLFSEGFEAGVIPGCWMQEYISDTYDWTIADKSGYNSTPASAHGGSKLARFYDGAWKSPVSKFITPPLDMSSAPNPTLKFWHTQAAAGSNQDKLYVYYRTSATGEWKLLQKYLDNIATWTLESISLPEVSSTYYIAFEGYAANGCGICLDDVEVWKDGSSTTNNWIGGTSTDWFTASNWSLGVVPTATLDVKIPAGTTYSPVISAAGALCQNITVDAEASLSMSASSAYTFNIYGDLTNNGSFDPGISTLSFQGMKALQTIGGTATTNFNVLEVKTGAIDNVLEATAPITLSSAKPNLSLVSGTLKISNTSTSITPNTSSSSTSLSIGSSCGIWNNGGTINPTARQCNLTGLLRNTTGTSNFNFLLPIGTTNKIRIEGGIVNISYYFEPYSLSTDIANYTQTGGLINIYTSSNPNSNISFILNTGSTFNMSGGTIAIQKASSATEDFQNLASTFNVTGGTLQIGNAYTTGSPVIRVNSKVPLYNLTVNGTGTPTAKLATNGLTVKNDVTIGSGAKLDLNSLNLSVAGNWTNNGGSLINSPTGTVTFNGSSAQSIAGSAGTIFNNVVLNNSNGLALSGVDATFNGTLSLTAGVISTGSNKVVIPSTGSISRASGHINGYLQKSIATGTAISQTFEIGDASNYTPASVTFANVSTAGNLTGSTTANDHPQIGSSTLDPVKSINRYWTLTNNGIAFDNYSCTLSFIEADKDASINTAKLIAGKYNGLSWEYPTFGSSDSPLNINGLTSFSDFAFAEKKVATGIADVSSDKSVLVYRNALNQIVVSIANDNPDEALISVYNSTGQTIARKRSSQTVTIIDTHLQAGVYMVTIQKTDKVLLKKVVIN